VKRAPLLAGAALALVATNLCDGTAAAQATPAAPSQSEVAGAAAAWRDLIGRDLDYLERTIATQYIYAAYPGDAAWQRLLAANLDRARQETSLVKDYPSYRAVLQHFVAGFEDAHFTAYFAVASRRNRWPGFTVQYRGRDYVISHSEVAEAAVGDRIESCDGESLDGWVDRLAPIVGGPPGRDTTRAAIGGQMFLDLGNPLYSLPRQCAIGGRTVQLAWRSAPYPPPPGVLAEPQRTSTPVPTLEDKAMAISDFGTNSAWVRIGTMNPTGPVQTGQFRDIIARAPDLRNRDAIIIDVRGNSGGVYNWFMAFLRSLYGQPYADHHARARLEITNVMLSPAGSSLPTTPASAAGGPDAMPPDPPLDAAFVKPEVRPLPGGASLTVLRAPDAARRQPGRAPVNPVKARVIVLADYGCASACISFVDEMRRFPGVTLVGTETHVDRRSGGWPEGFELPSGLATVRMGRMVREGRRRGENEPWSPDVRYPGDIARTDEVKAWIAALIAEK